MGGSGSQLKNLKNWWKFGDLEKFICIRYWSTDSVNFKSWPKSENFWHFWPFSPSIKPSTELFLFFLYTVDPCEHVDAFFWTKNPELFFWFWWRHTWPFIFMILDYVSNTNYHYRVKSHDVIIGRYHVIGEIIPEILVIELTSFCGDFCVTPDSAWEK